MSTTVNYKGSAITTVNNETKTLATSGKWLDADIELVDVSGSLSNDFIVTVTKDQNNIWNPDKTYADILAAYNGGKNIIVYADSAIPADAADGWYNIDEGYFEYVIYQFDLFDANLDLYRIKNEYYTYTSNGVTRVSTVYWYYPFDADATAADVANGKIFYTSTGRGVGTATLQNTFVVTLTESGGSWSPDCTFADLLAAYNAGLNIAVESYDEVTAVSGFWLTNGVEFDYLIEEHGLNSEITQYSYSHTSNGVSLIGTVVYYPTYDANATASDVAYGAVFYNANGRQTGSVTVRTSSDLTASGATVTVPAGIYSSSATKSVASGTEGTPTIAMVLVGSNGRRYTPQVTNTAGYISGGSHSGSPVTVYASDLVSGTLSITANGTSDCTNYASVNVAVPFSTIYTGNSAPSSGTGVDGDVYIQT